MVQAVHTDAEKIAKVHALINKIGTAFMVTTNAGGQMHGRPMATAKIEEGDQTIWFATEHSSGKIDELSHDGRVFLGYVNGTGSDWVCVNGVARVVDDKAKIKALWSPLWKMWFDGPDDPKIALIEVTPESAEYWDSGSRVLAMVKYAASAVTGKRMNLADHDRVEFSGAKSS